MVILVLAITVALSSHRSNLQEKWKEYPFLTRKGIDLIKEHSLARTYIGMDRYASYKEYGEDLWRIGYGSKKLGKRWVSSSEKATKEEIDFANLKLLECFCGISLKEAYNLELTSFSHILNHLSNIFKEETPLQQRFTMVDINGKEVEFGFIPNIEEITLGEFVDLEKYIQSWETMHKAMAVLYRPVTFKNKNLYLIEDYKGIEKYSDPMLDSHLNGSLGANVFFYHLGKGLLRTLPSVLMHQMKEMNQLLPQSPSQKSGDGLE